MADVFQIIATDKTNPYYDSDVVDAGDWHASYSLDDPRTVCGLQLVGEDGIASGPIKKGKVTCAVCREIIRQIQSIKGWK